MRKAPKVHRLFVVLPCEERACDGEAAGLQDAAELRLEIEHGVLEARRQPAVEGVRTVREELTMSGSAYQQPNPSGQADLRRCPAPPSASSSRTYDFVVIDGGTRTPAYYEALNPRALVFVEGGRRDQRAVLEHLYRSCRPFAHRHVKPWDRSKGYHVYQFEPSLIERMMAGLVNAGDVTLDTLARLLNRCGASIAVGKRRRTAGDAGR